jgi:hypothetical protein
MDQLIDRFVRDRTADLHRMADDIRRERDLRRTVDATPLEVPAPTALVVAAVPTPCGDAPTVTAARRAA